jgi:hypothetical protein
MVCSRGMGSFGAVLFNLEGSIVPGARSQPRPRGVLLDDHWHVRGRVTEDAPTKGAPVGRAQRWRNESDPWPRLARGVGQILHTCRVSRRLHRRRRLSRTPPASSNSWSSLRGRSSSDPGMVPEQERSPRPHTAPPPALHRGSRRASLRQGHSRSPRDPVPRGVSALEVWTSKMTSSGEVASTVATGRTRTRAAVAATSLSVLRIGTSRDACRESPMRPGRPPITPAVGHPGRNLSSAAQCAAIPGSPYLGRPGRPRRWCDAHHPRPIRLRPRAAQVATGRPSGSRSPCSSGTPWAT